MSFRRDLTETEVTLAFVMGGGLTLIIMAFLVAAIQSPSTNPSSVGPGLLIVLGTVFFIGGVFAWMVIAQPWQYFDDWSKPLYTGHVHDVHEAATHGQAIAEVVGAEHPDNLTVIPGISEKAMRILNAIGIYTFEQLAARKPAEIERLMRDSGIRVRGKAAEWVAQAKLLASKPH